MTKALSVVACPSCSADQLIESLEDETFPYGAEAVEIGVTVPVLRCQACGFAYTDQRAERARHAAVCQHLDILTPDEIQRIRKSVLGMTRETFHLAYGLSEASVERWENGKLFQNEAADTLMRALTDPATAVKLDRRSRIAPPRLEVDGGSNIVWGRFPALGSDAERGRDAVERSKKFELTVRTG